MKSIVESAAKKDTIVVLAAVAAATATNVLFVCFPFIFLRISQSAVFHPLRNIRSLLTSSLCGCGCNVCRNNDNDDNHVIRYDAT